MARKNARPAAKKRQARLKAQMKSGKRHPRARRPHYPAPQPDTGLSLGLAMAAMGAMGRFDTNRSAARDPGE